MNEALKARHMLSITEENAVELYNRLCAVSEAREGGMTDADQLIIADYARMEQMKQALLEDVKERGVGKEMYNGRQKYYQENKSVAQARAYMEQQRKHLAELRLTPNSRKAASVTLDDEFADF